MTRLVGAGLAAVLVELGLDAAGNVDQYDPADQVLGGELMDQPALAGRGAGGLHRALVVHVVAGGVDMGAVMLADGQRPQIEMPLAGRKLDHRQNRRCAEARESPGVPPRPVHIRLRGVFGHRLVGRDRMGQIQHLGAGPGCRGGGRGGERGDCCCDGDETWDHHGLHASVRSLRTCRAPQQDITAGTAWPTLFRRDPVAVEQTGRAGRVAAAPAAFGGDAEVGNRLGRGGNAAAVAVTVVMIDDGDIEVASLRQGDPAHRSIWRRRGAFQAAPADTTESNPASRRCCASS